jgi:hypothetical protein
MVAWSLQEGETATDAHDRVRKLTRGPALGSSNRADLPNRWSELVAVNPRSAAFVAIYNGKPAPKPRSGIRSGGRR